MDHSEDKLCRRLGNMELHDPEYGVEEESGRHLMHKEARLGED